MKWLLLSVFLMGCAYKGSDTVSTPATLDTILSLENAYRLSVGQGVLVKGLVCTLYTVPNGSVAIAGSSLTNVTTYSYGKALDSVPLPYPLSAQYMTWFVVRCTGKIIVTDSKYNVFNVTSDDGSMLYIDGAVVVNNDGNHTKVLKTGIKYMKVGVHDFRLDYMQAAGVQTLSVRMNNETMNLYY